MVKSAEVTRTPRYIPGGDAAVRIPCGYSTPASPETNDVWRQENGKLMYFLLPTFSRLCSNAWNPSISRGWWRKRLNPSTSLFNLHLLQNLHARENVIYSAVLYIYTLCNAVMPDNPTNAYAIYATKISTMEQCIPSCNNVIINESSRIATSPVLESLDKEKKISGFYIIFFLFIYNLYNFMFLTAIFILYPFIAPAFDYAICFF